MKRAIAAHAAGSLEELVQRSREQGPINCDPGLVPPDLADDECDLADALEAAGAAVFPSFKVRQRRLGAALRRLAS